MRIILYTLLYSIKLEVQQAVVDQQVIDQENKGRELEERLINEYGSCLIRQKSGNKIIYIFYKNSHNKKQIYTLLITNKEQDKILYIKKSSSMPFHKNRYAPTYIYTTSIHSTNNVYLFNKFSQSILEYLHWQIMEEVCDGYFSYKEKDLIKKLNYFASIAEILKQNSN